jgi:N-acetylmuramic acid 6-phosphate etherase
MKTTEAASIYQNLEQMSSSELLESINREDQKVAEATRACIPILSALVEEVVGRMQQGGRLFYLGAGTSGRLGIVDASECPPTYGVPHGWVIGLIAGGDAAIRKAVEFAEDDREQGWKDLEEHAIGPLDTVVGITASGTTPYVLGAVEKCKAMGILTAGITCNAGSPLAEITDFPLVAVVGPEFVTGSTRMKAGTAQKLLLNMLSTSVMVRLGRVVGNRMVDMQLSNNKLVDRGTKMVMDTLHIPYDHAQSLLLEHGSVRKAIEAHQK